MLTFHVYCKIQGQKSGLIWNIFLIFLLYSCTKSKEQDLTERNSSKMTGNCCDPPTLRKPSHHAVRPYWSLRKSERGCASEGREARELGMKTQLRKNVRYQKRWWCDFIILSEWVTFQQCFIPHFGISN